MQKIEKSVLGVMSGTSLDGIDLAVVHFTYEGRWTFEVEAAATLPYSNEWILDLQQVSQLSLDAIKLLDQKYTIYLANQINTFLSDHAIDNIDFISSHGHTVLHQPEKQLTYQIGNLPVLAERTQQTVVCDFRTANVALGGQGAPLVPGGEVHLFPSYDALVNLGGFSNISLHGKAEVQAYDICAVNVVLNTLAQRQGYAYDEGGALARRGALIPALFSRLEALDFYRLQPPKSLGVEWVEKNITPVLKEYEDAATSDLLFTYSQHIAVQIAHHLPSKGSVLFSGGGSYNDFLMERIRHFSEAEIVLPSPQIIEFKEAIIFAFLGLLRVQNLPNCLASVTGSSIDHSSGNIFFPSVL